MTSEEIETEGSSPDQFRTTGVKLSEPRPVHFVSSEDIPFDRQTLTGELENGMAYYVRANRHPRKRAELRIAIKVGSTLETEGERGIAHMIEHLAFRASRSCPQEFELIKELEAHGIKFGAHQNAYTAFEETVYELHVPADQPLLVQRSLRVLRQLALEVRLSDEDVEKERSIVVEEWRQGRGAMQRATEDFFKLLVKGSLFEKRLPIGLMEVIKSVTPEVVRSFYARHYHPEHMAVIAVGDFPDGGKGVVDFIADVFGGCKRGNGEPPPTVEVPSHGDVRAAVFSDSEVTSSSLGLEVKQPRLPLVTHEDYRREVTEDLFHACLNARLSKTAMRDRPPFLSASSSASTTISPLSSVQLTVTSLDGGLLRAMRAVLTEVYRVKIHGFSDREVSIAKENHLAEVRGDWVARDQSESQTLCTEYVEHFLRNNPSPGIEWEAGILRNLLGTVSTDDVNRVASRYSWGKDTVVFATCPAPGKLTRLRHWLRDRMPVLDSLWPSPDRAAVGTPEKPALPGMRRETGKVVPSGVVSREELLELMSRFEERGGEGTLGRHERMGSLERVREWSHDRWGEPLEVEDLLPDHLLIATMWKWDKLPTETVFPAEGEGIEVHEMTLANGMQVSYKVTDFCDDEMLFSGRAHGGRTELSPMHGPSALMAVMIAEELGVFGVKPGKAMDMLTGKRVNLDIEIDAYDREVGGSCAAADLEAALQLLYLIFTAELRWDEGRLETVLSYVEQHVANRNKDPQELFQDVINNVNTQGHPFLASPSLALLSKVEPRWAAAYFKSLFRNPAAFRFVFVGNMEPSTAVPLIDKYLGSIPRPVEKAPRVITEAGRRGLNVKGVLQNGERIQEGSSVVNSWPIPTLARTEVAPLNVQFPMKKVTKTVRVSMADPCAVLAITFPVALGGERHPTHAERLKDNILIQFAASVLERRLVEVLRFTLGRTYGASVTETFASAPPMKTPDQALPGILTIAVTCEPQQLPLLRRTTLEELRKLQLEGPRHEEVRGAVEADRRERETAERTNSYWLHSLSMQYVSPRYEGDVSKAYEELVECRKYVQETLSPAMLKEAYIHFFGDMQRRTEVVLLPQQEWKTARHLVMMGLLVTSVAVAGAVVLNRSRASRS